LASRAGRELAKWHLNYETVTPYPAKIETGNKVLGNDDYRVEKMRFGKSGKEKDQTTIIYNPHITVTGIPLEAYDYVVNGKSAIDWVMERQCVKTDKASGIVNDANDWAIDEEPALPTGATPARHHRQPRNHEDRQRSPQAHHPRSRQPRFLKPGVLTELTQSPVIY
jgi:hypothetical protein